METTKYYEYTTAIAPYYAIIVVTNDVSKVSQDSKSAHVLANGIYEEQLADLLDEDSAKHFGGNLISKEEAFYKFAKSCESGYANDTVISVINAFESITNSAVLVDGSLL